MSGSDENSSCYYKKLGLNIKYAIPDWIKKTEQLLSN